MKFINLSKKINSTTNKGKLISKLKILILFTPFIIYSIKDEIAYLPSNIKELIIVGTGNDFSMNIFLRLTLFILPLLSIAIFEIYNTKGQFFTRLQNIFLFKLRFEDIWYYFLYFFRLKVPFVFTLLTLGTIQINSEFGNFIGNLYKSLKIFPVVNNEFIGILTLITAIFFTELIEYWTHRIQHENPCLWDLHECHHSARNMVVINNYRVTPLESIVTSLIFLPIITFTGILILECLSKGYFIVFFIWILHNTIGLLSVYLGHNSSLRIIYPKPISYLLMSPSLHLLHHSDNPEHFDCNYNMRYSIFDRFFGTYLDEVI